MKLRRKIAIATWDAPREGNIYAKLVIDARPALDYIQKLRAEQGVHVTLTHFVTRAVAVLPKHTKEFVGNGSQHLTLGTVPREFPLRQEIPPNSNSLLCSPSSL